METLRKTTGGYSGPSHGIPVLAGVVALVLCCGWLVPAAQAQPFPPRGDDQFPSKGIFKVTLSPALGGAVFTINATDPNTVILRSSSHMDGGAVGDISGLMGSGASPCVGDPAPGVTDAQIGVHPVGYESGTVNEVHTKMCWLSMSGGGWTIRAGEAAPGQADSLGEVESRNPITRTGFPADSFFNLYFEVDVPATAGGPMTVCNFAPLLVEAKGITAFPPAQDDYLHSFKIRGKVALFDCVTGCFVGWLEEGAHGVSYNITHLCFNDDPDFPVVFSVDAGAEGLVVPDPCVPPHPEPNDVYALGAAGLANVPSSWGYATEGELFQSSGASPLGARPDMTNVDRMSASLGVGPAPFGPPPYMGPFDPNTGQPIPMPAPPGGPTGTLGLVPSDNVNALSFGRDGGLILLFSVDPTAVGRAGTAVEFNSLLSPALGWPAPMPYPRNWFGDPGNEAAGDVYMSAPAWAWGGWWVGMGGGFLRGVTGAMPFSNALVYDEYDLGLQAPADSPPPLNTNGSALGPPEDDLDALEADDGDTVDPDMDGIPNTGEFVFFSLDPASPTIALPGTDDPFPGLCTGSDAWAAGGDGVTTDDILIASPPGVAVPPFAFAIFARGVADIGLLAGDDLDALVLYDDGANGTLDPYSPPGLLWDEALFSLAAGSPSLVPGANLNIMAGAAPLSPGDVFWTDFTGTIWLYASANDLGLVVNDELNALDIAPEWYDWLFYPWWGWEEPPIIRVEPDEQVCVPIALGNNSEFEHTWTVQEITGNGGTCDYPWLSCASVAYTSPHDYAEVQVCVDSTGYSPGVYSGYLKFTNQSAPCGYPPSSHVNNKVKVVMAVEAAGACTCTFDGWASLRMHGAAGELAIELDASASGSAAVTETRRDGVRKIEVEITASGSGAASMTLTGDVVAVDVGSCEEFTASATLVYNGPIGTGDHAYTLVAEWTPGLPDEACYKIDLAGTLSCEIVGDTDCMVIGLTGDVNGDENVDLIDMAYVKSKNGSTVPPHQKFDVNTDGNVDLIDMALVKSLNGNSAGCGPQLIGAVSRKEHGMGGDEFDVQLPLDPPEDAGVECRQNGPTRVILTFCGDVEAEDGVPDETEVHLSDGNLVSVEIVGNEMTIEITYVPDGICLVITLDGIVRVSDREPLEGDNDVHIVVLLGDLDGDGEVGPLDVAEVQSQIGMPIDEANFRCDLNTDGNINMIDRILVQSALGNAASCP